MRFRVSQLFLFIFLQGLVLAGQPLDHIPISDCTRIEFIRLLSQSGSRLEMNKLPLLIGKKIEEIAQGRYGAYGSQIVDSLNALQEGYADLIVDPGIAFRLDRFMSWAKEQAYLPSNPWTARTMFKEYLGYKIAYRSMALSEQEHQAMIQDGIIPPSKFDRESKPFIYNHIFDALYIRMGQIPLPNFTLSISEHPQIANAVAKQFVTDERPHLYLYKIKIPIIDTIYFKPDHPLTDYQIHAPFNSFKNLFETVIEIFPLQQKGLVHKDQNQHFHYNQDVESFVFYKIDVSEILESKRVHLDEVPQFDFRDPTPEDRLKVYENKSFGEE